MMDDGGGNVGADDEINSAGLSLKVWIVVSKKQRKESLPQPFLVFQTENNRFIIVHRTLANITGQNTVVFHPSCLVV